MRKIPTEDEYKQLAREWQAANTQTEKNRVATLILLGLDGLIRKIVGGIARSFGEAMMEDCTAEAQISVIRSALPNYEEKKLGDAKFTNYMGAWIWQAARRTLDNTAQTIHFPVNRRHEALKRLKDGHELPLKEQAYVATTVYWDKPLQSKDSTGHQTLADVICANENLCDSLNIIDSINRQQELQICQDLLEDPEYTKAALIVKEYIYGKNFVEIAKERGMSKSNASRIYHEHIARLREKVSLSDVLSAKDGKHSQTATGTRLNLHVRDDEKLKLERS